MYFLFQILPYIIMLPIGIYFIFHFKNLPFIACFKRRKWLPYAIAAIPALLCIYQLRRMFKFPALVVLFLMASFMITDILHLIMRKLLKTDQKKILWNKIYRSAIIAVCLTLTALGIGYANARNVRFTPYTIETDKELDQPVNIIMISDLHFSTNMTPDELAVYCEQIQEQKPDLIVLVGDIFDEETKRNDMEAACRILGQLTSKYGTYYVFGNHDAGAYGESPEYTVSEMVINLKENGIIIVNDDTLLIDDTFYIIGRMDDSQSRYYKRASLEALLDDVNMSKFIILLDHQPLEMARAASYGIDLQLSGHTHGGQVWPVGLITTTFNIFEMNYGYKRIDNYQAIVSSGMGALQYPIRLGSIAEIVQIEIIP